MYAPGAGFSGECRLVKPGGDIFVHESQFESSNTQSKGVMLPMKQEECSEISRSSETLAPSSR